MTRLRRISLTFCNFIAGDGIKNTILTDVSLSKELARLGVVFLLILRSLRTFEYKVGRFWSE